MNERIDKMSNFDQQEIEFQSQKEAVGEYLDTDLANLKWQLGFINGVDLNNKNILEIGCGKGKFSFTLARLFPHARIHSTDVVDGYVRHCQKINNQKKFIFFSIICV